MKAAVLVVLVFAIAVFAASPVASVSSGSDFTLRGQKVTTAGVPSWPVLAGDSILAGTTPTKIRFQDGSVVMLSPDSSAKVEETDGGLVFRLISGSMALNVAPSSTLSVFSGQTAVSATPNVETSVSAGGAPSAGNRGTVSVSHDVGIIITNPGSPVALSKK